MMSALRLIIALGVLAVSIQANDEECGENQEYKHCGTACEPSCADPNPISCTKLCLYEVCQCKPGYVRNINKVCIPREECKNQGNVTRTLPEGTTLPPPTCPPREHFVKCGGSEKTCDNRTSLEKYKKRCDWGMCRCLPGYFRHYNGECVEEHECPPADLPSCGTTQCAQFEYCKMVEVECLKAPCHRVPKCFNLDGPGNLTSESCPANQTFTQCSSMCPMKCSENAMACAAMCGPPACQCSIGYALNAQSQCILQSDCPRNIELSTVPPVSNKCALVDCRSGMVCRVNTQGLAECVDPSFATTCANFSCVQGTTCRTNGTEVYCLPSEVTYEEVPRECMAMMCQIGTECRRNPSGLVRCFPSNSTDENLENETGCHQIRCTSGNRCAPLPFGGVGCVPDDDNNSNSTILANEQHSCENVENWDSCGGCEPTCENPTPLCNKMCKPGKCVCKPGLARKGKKCVQFSACPAFTNVNPGKIKCENNEIFTNIMPPCEATCRGVNTCVDTISTTTSFNKPGCVCRPNYKRNSQGKCVHQRYCYLTAGCRKNENWSACFSCEKNCETSPIKNCHENCYSGCACSDGFARNTTGSCVEVKQCPK